MNTIKIVIIEYDNIRNICKSKNIVFNHCKGKRKSEEQKKYEIFEEWLDKIKVYGEYLNILGERNSYSKIDKEGIFMGLKDDHMKNRQLKPINLLYQY